MIRYLIQSVIEVMIYSSQTGHLVKRHLAFRSSLGLGTLEHCAFPFYYNQLLFTRRSFGASALWSLLAHIELLHNYLEPGNYWYSKKDKNTNTEEKWQKKQQWITSLLNEIRVDIIGFQEVFSTESLQQLCLSQGYEHFKSVALVGRGEDDQNLYNRPIVALASKHPIRTVAPVGVWGYPAAFPLAGHQ